MVGVRQPGNCWIAWGLTLCMFASGCATDGMHLFKNRKFFGRKDDADVKYYKGVASEIAYPTSTQEIPTSLKESQPPSTAASQERTELWDMTLQEAIHIALKNGDVIVQRTSFLSPFNTLLTNPNSMPSVFDAALQETNPFFSQRGVESALSDFDANFSTRMVWGRNEQVVNNAFLAGGLLPGSTRTDETGNFSAALSKRFSNGDQFSFNHSVNYLGTNLPGQLFPSEYSGNLAATYRKPILAGAGTEFTRIAGPVSTNPTAIPTVFDGVVIARINNDISIADFEKQVHNLVRDVESIYWDLNLAYHQFDAAVKARDAALDVWRIIEAKLDVDANVKSFDEAQARDQFFATSASVASSRSQIFEIETQLRRILGLPVSDGKTIRPIDEPVFAPFEPDWYIALTEALVSRPEIRSQEWTVQRLEFQLKAANSIAQPRFDFVASYGVNGFGDKLAGRDGSGANAGVRSFYESLEQGDQTGWTLGFEFAMPVGFRQAKTAVRNYELRLVKAQKVLERQQLEIGHELAAAFQQLSRAYSTAVLNRNRFIAASERAEILNVRLSQDVNFDLLLRSQQSAAQAEIAYRTSVANYNKALADVQYRKGTILKYNNIEFTEGGWTPAAYEQALERAKGRTKALVLPHADHKPVAPSPFALPGSPKPIEFYQAEKHVSPVSEINPLNADPKLNEESDESNATVLIENLTTESSTRAAPTEAAESKSTTPPAILSAPEWRVRRESPQSQSLKDRLLNEQFLIQQIDTDIDR